MSSTPGSRVSDGLSTSGNQWSSLPINGKQGLLRPRQNVKFTITDVDIDPSSSSRIESPELHRTLTPEPAAKTNNLQDWTWRRDTAAQKAFANANRHATNLEQRKPASSSRRSSLQDMYTPKSDPQPRRSTLQIASASMQNIPLKPIERPSRPRTSSVLGVSTTDSEDESDTISRSEPVLSGGKAHMARARTLVESFRSVGKHLSPETAPRLSEIRSGNATPQEHQDLLEFDYVPRPNEYKPSVLSMLLAVSRQESASNQAKKTQEDYLASKLAAYRDPETDPRTRQPDFFTTRKDRQASTGNVSGTVSPFSCRQSGTSTPKYKRPRWYDNDTHQSSASISGMLSPAVHTPCGEGSSTSTPNRPSLSRSPSSRKLDNALHMLKHPISHIKSLGSSSSTPFEYPTTSIAERLSSQEYLLLMCRALMRLGAPTHRLEEYMTMAARKLCIAGSFQYLPNCMIVSFDDPITHTSELKLVKEPPAVDLGKLKDVQEVYKDVIHDKYSTQEAMDDIQQILHKPKKFKTPTLVLMYGIAAVAVGPFAFSARPIDFPIAFVLGSLLGVLQLLLAPRSSQFSHVFEVAGTFITSLAARGFGSILDSHGVPVFCFSALAQSSIALILPGWIILSAALELQSRNMIAGSIRMVYAIIYTLFLGFGILIGTTIMGLLLPTATNDITCHIPAYWSVNDPSESWRLIYTKFIWVPIFTVCLAMINQAKWRQVPWMVLISSVGYQVNYWSSQKFSSNIQVANALGAFAVGICANLYSRFAHGVAAAVMLPAIFVMVPSGLAASGSLVAGLTSANQITHTGGGISVINNGTQGFYDAQNSTTTSDNVVYGGTIFNVGYGMVQVAIGISVGLFLSALVVYPFGKRRSGLFSF